MSSEEFVVYKIAIIGDISVGKTSLIERFLGEAGDTKATVGVDIHRLRIIEDNKGVQLNVFDCSGDPKFRDASSHAFGNVKGIIFVYDITRRESFTNLQETWLKVADDFMEGDNHCPIFLVANKIDLAKEKEEVKKEEGEHLSTAQSASGFFETSAVTGQAVEKLFKDVASTMINTWGGFLKIIPPEVKKAIEVEQKEKQKKCKRIRRLFSCFSPCCSCKCKSKKGERNQIPDKAPQENATPLVSLTHDHKATLQEEEIKVNLKDSSDVSHQSDDEENQERRPLKSEEDDPEEIRQCTPEDA